MAPWLRGLGWGQSCHRRAMSAIFWEESRAGNRKVGQRQLSNPICRWNSVGKTACMLAFVGGEFARTWHRYAPDERRHHRPALTPIFPSASAFFAVHVVRVVAGARGRLFAGLPERYRRDGNDGGGEGKQLAHSLD